MLSLTGNRLVDCLLLIFILVLATTVVATQPDPLPGPTLVSADWDLLISKYDPAAVQKHIHYLASDAFEARATGTQGEDLAGFYLTRTLQQVRFSPWKAGGLNDYVSSFQVPVVPGQSLAGENIVGCWPGQNPDQFLLVTAFYDGRVEAGGKGTVGFADNSPAVAIALELGRCLSSSGLRPKRTVVIAFVSGEAQKASGARALVDQVTEQRLLENAVCLKLALPIASSPEQLTLTDAEYQKDGTPSELALRLQGELQRFGVSATVNHPAGNESDPLLMAGIPAIQLRSAPVTTKAPNLAGDVESTVWTSAQLSTLSAQVFRMAWVMANW